jgi:ABC-type phosphate transport system substrate-binding protein
MMNLYRRFILVGLFVSMIAESQGQEQDIVHLHGSGTTNPSKCYWDILSLMTNGIRHPSRLTYRSVGSSIGQEEIVNAFNTTSGAVDFASGDIPITTELYDGLTDQGIEILHLPVLLGAVTVFHSVPVNEPYQLNLTSCVLAKIFMGEITVWSDPIIAALNPEMLADNMPINVAVRDSGSSSTSSFTEVSFIGFVFRSPTQWHGVSHSLSIHCFDLHSL